jgi:hypothetical protein
LKNIYERLINDKDIKIKKVISNSFAEVSKILGYEVSETELSPLIMSMFKNSDIKIKESIIDILPDYIISINSLDIKLQYLTIIKKCFLDAQKSNKWRSKIHLIKFTGKAITAYNNDILFIEIFYFCIQMCFDNYNIIRIKASKTLSKLIFYFLTINNPSNNDKSYKDNCIIILKSFATNIHYHYRQLFIYMCKNIIFDENLLNNNIIDFLEDLSFDKISNVRITLGNFIYKMWIKSEKDEKYSFFKKHNKILKIIYRLKNDTDFDVRKTVDKIELQYLVKMIKDHQSEKIILKKNVNINFNNKFEDIKTIFGFSPSCLGISWIKDKNYKK